MNKITQWDLVVSAILDNGGWMKAYSLKGKHTKMGICGSEADKRMIEIFEKGGDTAEYTLEGAKLTIERSFEGKYRIYRIASFTPRAVNPYAAQHEYYQTH